jgi:DNA repair protein RadC
MTQYIRVAETTLKRRALGSTVAEGVALAHVAERRIDRPRAARDIARAMLSDLPSEHFLVLGLNGRYHFMASWIAGKGSIASCPVDSKEVYGPALRLGTIAALVLAHNHPSGDTTPSAEDIAITKRLIECGKMWSLPILDHIIVADEQVVSLREQVSLSW